MEVVAAATESLSSPSMTEEEKKQAEAAIQKLLATQQNDWNNGDLDAFMQVYWQSDQLTFASGGKVTRGWQATLDGYKAKYPNREKQGKLTFDNLEFQSLSNSVMLVLGTWHLERGEESIGGNFSLIWNRIDGQWRIVHDHTSVLDKP
jgi:beta-aspartyl-peptidase (threonine type)